MHGPAMAYETFVRRDEALQRRFDGVEEDVGQEAVDARIDRGRLRSEEEALARQRARQRAVIPEPARIDLLAFVAADALVVVTLKVIFARRFHARSGEDRMSLQHLVLEDRPELVIA